MPVYLEHIHQPTDEDWKDLQKIYNDAPDSWAIDATDIRKALTPALENDQWLIAGRFNSRLLGALKAAKDGTNIRLSALCVRKVTINRGVAHQMLHHISVWADQNNYTLIAEGVPDELANPLINRGFQRVVDGFIRNPVC